MLRAEAASLDIGHNMRSIPELVASIRNNMLHWDLVHRGTLLVSLLAVVLPCNGQKDRQWENEVLVEGGPSTTAIPTKLHKRPWHTLPVWTEHFTTMVPTTAFINPEKLVDDRRLGGRLDIINVRKSNTKFMAPIHGHHWPFDREDLPDRPPINSSYSIEGTYLWAVGLLGTVSNLAVVLTTIFSKRIKKPLHVLVGTLGVTDLFVSLVYIPSYTYFLLENGQEEVVNNEQEDAKWDFCVASRAIFVEIASVTLSIKTLIAVYLYMFTRCSKEVANAVFCVSHSLGFILLAWAINFLVLFVPGFVGWDTSDLYPNAFVCYKYTRWRDPNGPLLANSVTDSVNIHAIVTLVLHMVQLSIICFCFTQVHRAILRGRFISRKHKLDDKESQISYVKASKTTVLIFVSFCLCWLPIYIVNTADPLHNNLPIDLHRAAMDLLLTKSAINPFIYLYGVRSLRHEVKLFCLCRCRSDNRNIKFVAPRTSSMYSVGPGPAKSNSTDNAVEV